MSLNIDSFKGKTIKDFIYIDDEESCERFENKDQLAHLEIVFTDDTSIKIETVSGYSHDWIEILYNRLKK